MTSTTPQINDTSNNTTAAAAGETAGETSPLVRVIVENNTTDTGGNRREDSPSDHPPPDNGVDESSSSDDADTDDPALHDSCFNAIRFRGYRYMWYDHRGWSRYRWNLTPKRVQFLLLLLGLPLVASYGIYWYCSKGRENSLQKDEAGNVIAVNQVGQIGKTSVSNPGIKSITSEQFLEFVQEQKLATKCPDQLMAAVKSCNEEKNVHGQSRGTGRQWR